MFYNCFVPVRLVGGNSRQGRLEVFKYGVWGTVCANFFDDADARVVCSVLGFGYVDAFSFLCLIPAFHGDSCDISRQKELCFNVLYHEYKLRERFCVIVNTRN